MPYCNKHDRAKQTWCIEHRDIDGSVRVLAELYDEPLADLLVACLRRSPVIVTVEGGVVQDVGLPRAIQPYIQVLVVDHDVSEFDETHTLYVAAKEHQQHTAWVYPPSVYVLSGQTDAECAAGAYLLKSAGDTRSCPDNNEHFTATAPDFLVAQQVYRHVLEHTGSFQRHNIGADLAYLLGAILCGGRCQWEGSRPLVVLLRELGMEHPVWAFIEIVEWSERPLQATFVDTVQVADPRADGTR